MQMWYSIWSYVSITHLVDLFQHPGLNPDFLDSILDHFCLRSWRCAQSSYFCTNYCINIVKSYCAILATVHYWPHMMAVDVAHQTYYHRGYKHL